MTELTLDAIRDCMEGAVPATIATSSAEGEPNVAYLSQVEYVDSATLALSFQFFNQTRRNVLANPVAHLIVTHPRTGARYRLRIRYRGTQTSGPLFERMKAKLAGSKPAEIKATCIATLQQAGTLLDAKAPGDAAAFKGWLRRISQHVAEAADEGGGFLGIGGVPVSEAEKATLTEISSALRLAA